MVKLITTEIRFVNNYRYFLSNDKAIMIFHVLEIIRILKIFIFVRFV